MSHDHLFAITITKPHRPSVIAITPPPSPSPSTPPPIPSPVITIAITNTFCSKARNASHPFQVDTHGVGFECMKFLYLRCVCVCVCNGMTFRSSLVCLSFDCTDVGVPTIVDRDCRVLDTLPPHFFRLRCSTPNRRDIEPVLFENTISDILHQKHTKTRRDIQCQSVCQSCHEYTSSFSIEYRPDHDNNNNQKIICALPWMYRLYECACVCVCVSNDSSVPILTFFNVHESLSFLAICV